MNSQQLAWIVNKTSLNPCAKFCKFGADCAYVHLVDTSKDVKNQLSNLNLKERNNELRIKFLEDEVKDLKLLIKRLIDTKKMPSEVEETIQKNYNYNESKTLKQSILQQPKFKCDICDCSFKREVTLKKHKTPSMKLNLMPLTKLSVMVNLDIHLK